MKTSRTFDVELPDSFVDAYDAIGDRAAIISNPNDATAEWKVNAWFGFTAGWIGFAMRLRSAVEYSEEFGSLIVGRTSVSRSDQYFQERALFGCVTSALSALECFFLASYCIAKPIWPDHFPSLDDTSLRMGPPSIAKTYTKLCSDHQFSKSLSDVVESKEYEALRDIRNVLSHRGTLPRQAFLSTHTDTPSAIPSNPTKVASHFNHDAHLNVETTKQHVQWVIETLSKLTTELLRASCGRD